MSIDVTDRQSGSAADASTGRLTIENPIAEPQAHQENADRHPPASRLDGLAGKTIALYWNGKQNGLDALARTKENLATLYRDIRFIDVVGELGGTTVICPPASWKCWPTKQMPPCAAQRTAEAAAHG
jgi:hypothetical protein